MECPQRGLGIDHKSIEKSKVDSVIRGNGMVVDEESVGRWKEAREISLPCKERAVLFGGLKRSLGAISHLRYHVAMRRIGPISFHCRHGGV